MLSIIKKYAGSFLLALSAMIGVFCAAQIQVHAVSKADLSDLMKKFPDGKYWNHVGSYENNPDGWTDIPCPHVLVEGGEYDYYVGIGYCNEFGGDVQCVGFANRLIYEAYGTESYEQWETTSLDNLKPGDVIRYKMDMHTIFVTSVDGEKVTYSDCNGNFSDCQIKWNQNTTKTEISDSLTAVYSAPSTLSVPLDNHSAVSTDKLRANSEITVWGIGEGGTEKYVYQFSVLTPDTDDYTILKEYADESVFRYTPTVAGKYSVKIQLRDSSGQVSLKKIGFTVTEDDPVTVINGQKIYFAFQDFRYQLYSTLMLVVLFLTSRKILS